MVCLSVALSEGICYVQTANLGAMSIAPSPAWLLRLRPTSLEDGGSRNADVAGL